MTDRGEKGAGAAGETSELEQEEVLADGDAEERTPETDNRSGADVRPDAEEAALPEEEHSLRQLPSAPSMLDLVRLSRRPLFPPGGQELYRQIALLTGMEPDQEVLVAGSGAGLTASYFVEEFKVQAFGVDVDTHLVEQAEERAREAGLRGRLQFQQAPLDKLPYRNEIFDVVVGELGLAAHAEPADALSELVRVTKPGGRIALIQLVWKAPVDPDRQRILTGHLGARPLMLVEWKKLLRQAGVEALHTEAWSDEETAFRPSVKKPFPDFAEMFTLPEKLGILRRAWGRWGWHGVRAAVTREMEVHRLLTRERIVGLDLVAGRKRPLEAAASPAPPAPSASEGEGISRDHEGAPDPPPPVPDEGESDGR